MGLLCERDSVWNCAKKAVETKGRNVCNFPDSALRSGGDEKAHTVCGVDFS